MLNNNSTTPITMWKSYDNKDITPTTGIVQKLYFYNFTLK